MLKHLTAEQLNNIYDRCRAVENCYTTSGIGAVERKSAVPDDHVSAKRRELLAALNELSDDAAKELQALMWLGRGEMDGSYSAALSYSQARFEHSSREYMASKTPLRSYIEAGHALLGNKQHSSQ